MSLESSFLPTKSIRCLSVVVRYRPPSVGYESSLLFSGGTLAVSANWDGRDLVMYSHGWSDMRPSGQPAEFIRLHLARRKQVSNLGIRSAPPVSPTSQILHARSENQY